MSCISQRVWRLIFISKERELLALILSYAGNKYLTVDEFEMMAQIEETFKEIQELLAQPEPLTPRQGLEEYKRGYARAELDLKREPLGEEESYHEAKRLYEAEDGLWYADGFVDGLKFAENMHGITGGGE